MLLGLAASVILVIDPTYVQDHQPKFPSAPSPIIHDYYGTDLPGQDGFEEYYRSKGVCEAGSTPCVVSTKAVPAGKAVCSDISLIGYPATKAEVESDAQSPDQAKDLLYASVHYLCPQFQEEYSAG